jgi:quercetin dioxygenase-like cupin family protein
VTVRRPSPGITLPPHSHGDQWGTVLAGQLALTREGETRVYRPGES